MATGFGLAWYLYAGMETPPPEPPAEVEEVLTPGVAVETAAISSLEMTYPVLGVLRSPGTGPVAWKAGGDVVRVWVVEGDVVDDGDPLAAVDCEIPAFERGRARVAKEGSEVARELAARRLARLEAVGGSGGVSAETLDLARSALAAARLDAEAAAIALGLTERAVRDCTVTAPFAARVEVVVPRVGATVAPGAPMAILLPLSGLRLEVDLVPEVAASLGEGTLLTDDLGRLWTLAHAGAVVDRASGSVRTIWLPKEEVDAADGIWLGGRILRETRTGVVVPVGALVDKDGLGVFIVGPDLTLEFRLVLQMASVAGRTLVEGILPGELVVVARPGRMEDGDLVTILEG